MKMNHTLLCAEICMCLLTILQQIYQKIYIYIMFMLKKPHTPMINIKYVAKQTFIKTFYTHYLVKKIHALLDY